MSEIHHLDAIALGAAIASGELSAVEATVNSLERAERYSERLGAFVHLARREALAAAAGLDAHPRLAVSSPLRGVPCPVKDLARVKGMPFEQGSASQRGTVAGVDDGVVLLLRDAGTVMVGKTTACEFGLTVYTEPDIAPPARTPWDPRRSAGGSSGGAAAAVAAGLVPIAHASDGGGSIRVPASVCGLVGLKPSRGRVSSGPHGVDGIALSATGVLTRTVRDTAAGLDALAHPWPGDQYRLSAPPQGFLAAIDEPPPRLRVGVLTAPSNAEAEVHPACLRAVDETAALLAGLGHHLEQAPPPHPVERWRVFMDLWAVMALGAPVEPSREHELTAIARWLRERGRRVSGLQHAQALASAQQLAREVAVAWQGFDVILTPTLAQPPVDLGALRNDDDPEGDFWAQTRYTPWGSTANLSGRASISLPLHRELIDGVELPIGVMLTGTNGGDEMLLRLARELELARGWPGLPVDEALWAQPRMTPSLASVHEH